MRNNFNIVRSIGLLFFGVGVLLDGITIPEFIRMITYYYDSSGIDILVLVMLTGFALTIVGLAGILKFRWFPIAGIIILILVFLLGNWMFYDFVTRERIGGSKYLIILTMLLTFWVLVISMIFLMRNEYFLEALKTEDRVLKEQNEILDDWNEYKE